MGAWLREVPSHLFAINFIWTSAKKQPFPDDGIENASTLTRAMDANSQPIVATDVDDDDDDGKMSNGRDSSLPVLILAGPLNQ